MVRVTKPLPNPAPLELLYANLEWAVIHGQWLPRQPDPSDTEGLCAGIGYKYPDCRCAEHHGVEAFAAMAGAENLYKWTTWYSTNDHLPHPIPQHLKAFIAPLQPDPNNEYYKDLPDQCQGTQRLSIPRFQLDDNVLDEEVIKALTWVPGAAKLFNCRGAELRGFPSLEFWDKETLEIYKEQWRAMYHDTMGDYVSDDDNAT